MGNPHYFTTTTHKFVHGCHISIVHTFAHDRTLIGRTPYLNLVSYRYSSKLIGKFVSYLDSIADEKWQWVKDYSEFMIQFQHIEFNDNQPSISDEQIFDWLQNIARYTLHIGAYAQVAQ